MIPKVGRSRILAAVLVGAFLAPVITLRAAALAPAQAKAPAGEETFHELADQAGRAQHRGQSEEAVRLYREALRIRPKWADGWRNLGILLADRKDYTQAGTAFKSLLRIDPKNGSGWALLGLCEFEQGRYDEALGDVVRARQLGIQNPDLNRLALFHEALLLIHKSQFEAAELLLLRVARAGVEDPDLITALGLGALRIPSFPDQLDPDRRALAQRVGTIDFQGIHGSVDEASSNYKKLLAEQPRTKGLHYAYGQMLSRAGEFDPSIEEMQKELELNPGDVMAMLQIAMTNMTLSRPEQSLPYAKKAARLAPKLFATHYVLGRTLDKLGRSDRAVKELEEAARLAPSSAEVHFALFQAYSHANRKSDALRERKIFAELEKKEVPQDGSPSTP
jgi:tetratricopeptide (TPR) repeat protein